VAGVQADLGRHAFGELAQDDGKVVVLHEGAALVEIVGIQDLVHAVGEPVPLGVANLGAVAGVVEDEAVTSGARSDELRHAGEDRALGRVLVLEERDVRRGEAELLHQHVADVGDVIDAPQEVVLGAGVVIDADEESALGHGGIFSGLRRVVRSRSEAEELAGPAGVLERGEEKLVMRRAHERQ
jgi:hypothetical protein